VSFDLVIAGARLGDRPEPVEIGFRDGTIAAIDRTLTADGPREDAGGCLAFGGFVETHIHLDKALILDRCPICEGTLREAVALTTRAKANFTTDDVRARASRVVEMAVVRGTTRMRSFVEVDPRAGMRSFEALLEVRREYGWAIDIELCAFAQEGLTNEPETLGMLGAALRGGASLVGGCPYTDPDPVAHVGIIFDLAERHDVDVDFHADFDLDPRGSILPEIIAQTQRRGYAGRVTVGHVTKLSAMQRSEAETLAEQLAGAGIAVTVLPATDLFLAGRGDGGQAPRGLAPAAMLAAKGVLVSLATNNVLNPFTPYGDASLMRMANLYANVAQLSRDADLAETFAMVTTSAARQLRAPHGIAVGQPADLVLIDAPDPAAAVRGNAQVLRGWKRGRATFRHDRPELLYPSGKK